MSENEAIEVLKKAGHRYRDTYIDETGHATHVIDGRHLSTPQVRRWAEITRRARPKS
jgi:hypothetical protein